MVRDTLERQRRKSSPYLRRLVQSQEEYILCPYSPHSWWHELGRSKMVKRLEAKGFPSLFGWLFVTLTIDPELFEGPEQAYERGCARLRKMVFWLREQGYNIERSFWKFELTQAGWPHWHMGLDSRGAIDNEDVSKAWALGFTKTKRVKKQRDFRYLFKYVVKDVGDGGEIPDWVLDRKKTIRVFQTSAGFYGKTGKPSVATKDEQKETPIRPTLREKFAGWRRRGLIRGRSSAYFGVAVYLTKTFTEIFIEQAENGQRPLDMYHMPLSLTVIPNYIKKHDCHDDSSLHPETIRYLTADGRIEKDLAGVSA